MKLRSWIMLNCILWNHKFPSGIYFLSLSNPYLHKSKSPTKRIINKDWLGGWNMWQEHEFICQQYNSPKKHEIFYPTRNWFDSIKSTENTKYLGWLCDHNYPICCCIVVNFNNTQEHSTDRQKWPEIFVNKTPRWMNKLHVHHVITRITCKVSGIHIPPII